ncbi:hypothetical protein [Nonomuraea sp. NPDC050783]|uniref:hypothetical protein n=1 Tax=Nonomuraea sp. NPDC050783 TaxID=3154634 RepID=UPI0034657AA3
MTSRSRIRALVTVAAIAGASLLSVVCAWKKGDCTMKTEHDPPWSTPIPGHHLIFLADRFSHTSGWRIRLKKATTDPPNCQIDLRPCA